MHQRQGILLLVSGPSGSGKTTLCERIAANKEAYYATSCTTRNPRPGEIDGKDYFFLSKQQFQAKIEQQEFIEFAEVHGNYYGTLKSEIIEKLLQGQDVVMDIDVQGAENVRNCDNRTIQQSLVDLFIKPENNEELRKRLVGRQTDSEEIIATRMQNALEEMEESGKYTYLLISSDKETDYHRFKSLLLSERLRQSRLEPT